MTFRSCEALGVAASRSAAWDWREENLGREASVRGVARKMLGIRLPWFVELVLEFRAVASEFRGRWVSGAGISLVLLWALPTIIFILSF